MTLEKDFYIVLVNDPNFDEIIGLSTYFHNKPRCSLDESEAVIQLKDGQQSTPLLDPYPPIKPNDCCEIMQSSEWQNNIF